MTGCQVRVSTFRHWLRHWECHEGNLTLRDFSALSLPPDVKKAKGKVNAMTQAIVDQENDTDQNDIESSELLGKEERKHRFVVLRAKGLSYAKIAKELKVSTSMLSNWNQELLDEIAQARAMELEALQEEFFLLKKDSIRLLGGQLKSIQAEICKRDLSEIKTDKLMEFQLRFFEELKGELFCTFGF